MGRIPFLEKYVTLPERWGIDEEKAKRLMELYWLIFEQNKSLKIELPKDSFQDIRTDVEYIYDLIEGWLFEDIIFSLWLPRKIHSLYPNLYFKVLWAGSDRNRVLQSKDHKKITTKPDVMLVTQDSKVNIELQIARQPRMVFDMKTTKVNRAKFSKIPTVFLWILVPSDSYFVLDPNILEERFIRKNSSWGNKEVYSINIYQVKELCGIYSMKDDLPYNVRKLLRLEN